MHFAYVKQNVNMIGYSSYYHVWGVNAPNDGCQICVDARPNFFIEKLFPILRAENQVCVQLRE